MCRRSASAARSTASTRTRSEAGTITGATIRRNSIRSAPRKQRKIRSTPRFSACSAPNRYTTTGCAGTRTSTKPLRPSSSAPRWTATRRWCGGSSRIISTTRVSPFHISSSVRKIPSAGRGIEKGLPMQFEILDEYVKSGKCSVMTMVDTGE